jgi:hypothetical protein
MGPRWGPDTKTDWPIDCRSQNKMNLNMAFKGCTKASADTSTPISHELQYFFTLWLTLKRKQIVFLTTLFYRTLYPVLETFIKYSHHN